jgi:hypothetical protein
MAFCFCRFILAALVILFAWLNVSWSNIALTIIGVLLLVSGFSKSCCCTAKKEQ